jgi:hypothetical protein
MIDRGQALSVTKQAEAAGLARSTVYYLPRPAPAADLEHLEFPFAGARMLRRLLAANGSKAGRRHVKTLMRRMGIEALYRRPRTTKPEPGHKVYPYLLRGMEIVRPNQVWAMDITYIPMALVLAACAVAARVHHDGSLVLHHGIGRSARQAREAGDLQHGSRLSIHGRGLHQRAHEE